MNRLEKYQCIFTSVEYRDSKMMIHVEIRNILPINMRIFRLHFVSQVMSGINIIIYRIL